MKKNQGVLSETGKKRPIRKAKNSQNPLARIFVRIGIALLILIPTYFAIIGFVLVKNAPEEAVETYYTGLEVNGPSGVSFTVPPPTSQNATSPESKLFEAFQLMLSDAVYTTGIPDTHLHGKYTVTMHTNTGAENYTFHFSTTDGAAYFTNANGTIYRTADGLAESFLNSPYAYELYPQSTPPVLTTAVTDKVTPSQLSWYYQTKNGTFANLSQVAVTNEILTYPIANDISFSFSLPPSSCTLMIKNGETIQRYDTLDNISLPTLTQGTVLEIEIEANFAENSRHNYYGRAVYRFCMTVVEAASFSLDATAKNYGDYFVLTCHNVRNETELTISAEPALQNAPIVFKRGELVYAAIPADAVCNPRQLTVVYGSVSDTFELTIHNIPSPSNLTFASTDVRGNWQEVLNTLLTDKMKDKGAAQISTTFSDFLPNVNFCLPADSATRRITFGDSLTVTGSSIENKAAIFEFYETNGGVLAMAGGYVVETGYDDLLGNYIILDHGGGIYTWYCGLGDIAVYLKNLPANYTHYVRAGERIGTAGQTGIGLSDTDGVMILATCGKTAISPQYLRQHTTMNTES